MAATMKMFVLILLSCTMWCSMAPIPDLTEFSDYDVSPTPQLQLAPQDATMVLAVYEDSIGNSRSSHDDQGLALRCSVESPESLAEECSRIWWSRHDVDDDDNDDDNHVASNDVVLTDDDGMIDGRQRGKNGITEAANETYRVTTDVAKPTSLLQFFGSEEFINGRYSCSMAFGVKTYNASCLVRDGRALCSGKTTSSHGAGEEQSSYTTQPQQGHSVEDNRQTTSDAKEEKDKKTSSDSQSTTSMRCLHFHYPKGSANENLLGGKEDRLSTTHVLLGVIIALMIVIVKVMIIRWYVRSRTTQRRPRSDEEVRDRQDLQLWYENFCTVQARQEGGRGMDMYNRDTISASGSAHADQSHSDSVAHAVQNPARERHYHCPRVNLVDRGNCRIVCTQANTDRCLSYGLFYNRPSDEGASGENTAVWHQMSASGDSEGSITWSEIGRHTNTPHYGLASHHQVEIREHDNTPLRGLPTYHQVETEVQQRQDDDGELPQNDEPPLAVLLQQLVLSRSQPTQPPPPYESQAPRCETHPISFGDLPDVIRPPSYRSVHLEQVAAVSLPSNRSVSLPSNRPVRGSDIGDIFHLEGQSHSEVEGNPQVDEAAGGGGSQEGEVIPEQGGDARPDLIPEQDRLEIVLCWLFASPPAASDSE